MKNLTTSSKVHFGNSPTYSKSGNDNRAKVHFQIREFTDSKNIMRVKQRTQSTDNNNNNNKNNNNHNNNSNKSNNNDNNNCNNNNHNNNNNKNDNNNYRSNNNINNRDNNNSNNNTGQGMRRRVFCKDQPQNTGLDFSGGLLKSQSSFVNVLYVEPRAIPMPAFVLSLEKRAC